MAALVQSGKDVEHVLGAGMPCIEHELNRDQHPLQPMPWYRRQHLRHHPITACATQQRTAEPLERLRHVGKRRAVAQRAGLRAISGT